MSDYRLQIGADTRQLFLDINKAINKIKPVDIKVNAETKGMLNMVSTINKTASSFEKLEREEAKTAIQQQKLDKATAQTELAQLKLKNAIDKTNSTIKQQETRLSKWFGSLKKVFTFGTATMFLSAFYTTLQKGKEVIYEFDKSLIELAKVSDLTGQALKDFKDDAYNLAKQLHTSAISVTDAVTEFKKSGRSLEEAKVMSESSIKFQAIADEAMTASESAKFLTQTMNAYNMVAKDSVKIIDSVNEVSNKYSISSGDLSKNIGKVTSVANLANVSFDQLLGLITASNTSMQNASKVTNGYKTILTNLMTKDLTDKFAKIGIDIDEASKGMTDIFGLLEIMSKKYKDNSVIIDETTGELISGSREMFDLFQDIAGTHNINVLVSALSSFDIAVSATKTSMESAGSAQREYEKSLEGIEAKLRALNGGFVELVTDGALTSLIKLIIDGGVALLTFANTGVGKTIINIALLTGGIKLLNVSMGVLNNTSLATFLKQLILVKSGLASAVEGTLLYDVVNKGLTKTILAQTKAWALSPFGKVALAVGAVALIAKTVKSLNEIYETQNEKLIELQDEYNNLSAEVEGLRSISNPTQGEKDRLALLEAELVVQKELLDIQRQKTFEAFDAPKLNIEGLGLSGVPLFSTGEDDIQTAIDNYNYLQEKMAEVEAQKQAYIASNEALKASNQEGSQEYLDNAKAISELDDTMQRYESSLTTTEGEIVEYGKTLGDFNDSNLLVGTTFEGLYDNILDIVGVIKEKQEVEEDDDKGTTVENLEKTTEAYKEQREALSSTMETVENLKSCVDDYNNSQGGNIDALLKLLELDSEYLSLLEMQNGVLSINETALSNLVTQKANEAKISAVENAMAQAGVIANNELSWAISNVGTSANDKRSSLKALGDTVLSTGAKFASATGDVAGFMGALGVDTSGLSENAKNQIAGIFSGLQTQLSLIDQVSTSFVSSGGYKSPSKASGGSKSTSKTKKDPIKEKKEVFDEIIKDLEFELYLLEQEGASQEARVDKQKEIQATLKKQEKWFRSKGLDDNDDYIQETVKQWYGLADDINDIYEDIFKEQQKIREEALEQQVDEFENAFDVILNKIDSEMELLEKQEDLIKEKYSAEIDLLEEKNDKREKSIDLMKKEQEVAKAEVDKKMILKDGKFVYASDITDVSVAKEELEEAKREQALEEQIETLEKNQEAELDILRDKINAWEEYKEEWESVVDSYETKQNELFANQVFGIDVEKMVWETRIRNIQDFATQYEKILTELNNVQSQEFSPTNKTFKSSSVDTSVKAITSSQLNNNLVGQKYNSSLSVPIGDNSLDTTLMQSFANNLPSYVPMQQVDLKQSGGITQIFKDAQIILQGVNSPDDLATALSVKFKNYAKQYS